MIYSIQLKPKQVQPKPAPTWFEPDYNQTLMDTHATQPAATPGSAHATSKTSQPNPIPCKETTI